MPLSRHHPPRPGRAAAPTGLTLACELAKRNIAFRIVERSAEYPRGSRAKGVQPRSLEILNELDIAREAVEFGSLTLPFRRFKGNLPLGDVQRPDFPRPEPLSVFGTGQTAAALQQIGGHFTGQVKTQLLTEKAAIDAFAATPDAIYVIRPDGYIGITASPDQATAVIDWLSRFVKSNP